MGALAVIGARAAAVWRAVSDPPRPSASNGEFRPYPAFNSAYNAASSDRQDTAEWRPNFGSADGDLLPARDLIVARVRDVVRNDPTARAAVERLVDMIVGHGLRLSSKPDAATLGLDAKQARELAKAIQREWNVFARDPHKNCDAQRRLSLNGLLRLAARSYFIAGDATAALDWRPGPQRYSTCVLSVDPDRLSNPYGRIDSPTLRGGVELDDRGAPIGYHVREAHAGDWWAYGKAWTWTYTPRATAWGRPLFIHAFEPDREGQTKGLSPFVSLINRLRMIGKFADNELAAAAANALFAAFVTSDLPVDEVAERMTPQKDIRDHKSRFAWMMDWYEKHPARIGGVRIPVMLPGSEVKMNSAPRQTTAFPAFQTAFLHSIASSLNLSYEQLTMDWSRVNYSSARAALNEVWRSTQRLRGAFVEQFVDPIYYAVIEEAFDRGYIETPKGAPSFEDNPGAYLGARWIGPGRGVVDALKEAEAATMRIETLTSTLEIECAALGHDYLEILDQLVVEDAELAERNLSRQSVIAATRAARGPKPDSEDVEDSKTPEASEAA